MDRFSFIALDLSLRALIEDPSLHKRFREGGETIVFRANDFADPGNSEILRIMAGHPNLKIPAQNFALICEAHIDAVPSLEDFVLSRNTPGFRGPASNPTGSTAPIVSPRPAGYLGPCPVLSTDGFAAVMSQVGNRIELVGRIHAVKRGVGKRGRGRLQPYVFVNFGHWRCNIVKLTIWSEELAQLNEVPDEKWIGRWVSVVGLVDQPYSGKHYNFRYTHVGITIHGAQQINIITENEANFRLGRISGSMPTLSTVSVNSQSNLPSPQIGGSRSANQDILRALRQHVALGSPSVQMMPPPPVSPGASTPPRTENLTSRVIRVLAD